MSFNTCLSAGFSSRKYCKKCVLIIVMFAGSKKSNAISPAQISILERKNSSDKFSKVTATFLNTHTGHKQNQEELAHIHLTKQEKLKIATDLQRGVPDKRIIKDHCIHGDNFQFKIRRLQMINADDIRNIRATLNINKFEGESNAFTSDVINVEMFVQTIYLVCFIL